MERRRRRRGFFWVSATKNKRLSVQREPNVKITGRGAKVGERGLLGGSSVRFSSTLLCVPCALSASSYYLYTPCLFLRVVDPPSPFSRASEVTWMIGLSLSTFLYRKTRGDIHTATCFSPSFCSTFLFLLIKRLDTQREKKMKTKKRLRILFGRV